MEQRKGLARTRVEELVAEESRAVQDHFQKVSRAQGVGNFRYPLQIKGHLSIGYSTPLPGNFRMLLVAAR